MIEHDRGGIFVSYRRQDTSHLAGRLYDWLADRFGEGQVFIDVNTIEPGVDFAEEIFSAVAACKVLLAIIGPTWLTATGERGHRRLDDPGDIVRLEIEAALARGVRVIPILVEGAVMPAREDLPESLAGLARRNALLIRHESFRYDAGRLATAIERVLAASRTAVSPADRLLADAERITISITDTSNKAWPLGAIARALVATDPDRAERIANSIADKYWRALALSDIAETLAATDSGRAGRLFADAERIANSTTNDLKASALRNVGTAMAATNPDRAERIANSISSEGSKAEALSRIAEAMAATDPDRAARLFADAERIANSITGSIFDEGRKASTLSRIAKAMAATDPDRAERIVDSITDEYWKISPLGRIAEALAATDPDRAGRLFADAERIANSFADSTFKVLKASPLSDVAKAMAATDPDRAERIADSITDGYWKISALGRIAEAMAATDPDRAERIADSITDGYWKISALSRIAEALAATDPDRAARLFTDAERVATSITDEASKAWALTQVAAALAATPS